MTILRYTLRAVATAMWAMIALWLFAPQTLSANGAIGFRWSTPSPFARDSAKCSSGSCTCSISNTDCGCYSAGGACGAFCLSGGTAGCGEE